MICLTFQTSASMIFCDFLDVVKCINIGKILESNLSVVCLKLWAEIQAIFDEKIRELREKKAGICASFSKDFLSSLTFKFSSKKQELK